MSHILLSFKYLNKNTVQGPLKELEFSKIKKINLNLKFVTNMLKHLGMYNLHLSAFSGFCTSSGYVFSLQSIPQVIFFN